MLTPDESGLSRYTVDQDGLLSLVDKDTFIDLSGEFAVDYVNELLLGAGENPDRDDLLLSLMFDLKDGELTSVDSEDATVSSQSDFERIELGRSGDFIYVLDTDILDSSTNQRGSVRVYEYSDDGQISSSEVDSLMVGQAPENLTIHPAGRYIYAINSFDDDISRIEINASNGQISNRTDYRPGGNGSGVGRPLDMKFHPNGRYAYVSLEDDREMVRYVVGNNGTLDNISRTSPPSDNGDAVDPGPIGMHPNGRFLYVGERGAARNIAVYQINQSDFTLTFQSRIDVSENPSWIEVDPMGQFLLARYGDGSLQSFSIDQTTGEPSLSQTVDNGDQGTQLPSLTLVSPLQ